MCVYRVSHSNQLPFSQKIMEHFFIFYGTFIYNTEPSIFIPLSNRALVRQLLHDHNYCANRSLILFLNLLELFHNDLV